MKGAILFGLLALACSVLVAQNPAPAQTVAPVYEGWEQNPDGSFNLVFGYFNRNWDEELDIPTGPNNVIEPGAPDQGFASPPISAKKKWCGRSRAKAKPSVHTRL
jgi:hypothetical protein